MGIVTMVFVYSLTLWQYGTPTTFPWGISIINPEYKYHLINVYLLLISLPMLIWQWKTKSSLGSGNLLINFLMFYGMGFMLVSLFKTKDLFLFGLSGEQLVYLMMVISGFLLSIFLKNRNETRTGETK